MRNSVSIRDDVVFFVSLASPGVPSMEKQPVPPVASAAGSIAAFFVVFKGFEGVKFEVFHFRASQDFIDGG